MYNSITSEWPKRRRVLDFNQDPTDPTDSITSVNPLEDPRNDVLGLGKPPAMEAASKISLLPKVNTPSIDFMDNRANGLISDIPLNKPSNKPILLHPDNGNKVADLPQLTMPAFDVGSPAIDLKAPLVTPLEMEAPTPIGYRPSLTIDRNASQIEALPAGANVAKKYVRGIEEMPAQPQLDPYAQARLELGEPRKRGVKGVLKDIALGFATGGAGGALLNGLEGGNIRHQLAFDNRVGEIKDNIELQRRNRLDNENSAYKQTQIDNIYADNARLDKARVDAIEKAKRAEEGRTADREQQKQKYERDAAFREKQADIKARLSFINRDRNPESRAQSIAALAEMHGLAIPEGFDPIKQDIDLRIDANGNPFLINKTQGTSSTVQAPTGNGQLQIAQKQPRVTEADVRSQLYSEYSQKYPDGQIPNPEYNKQKASLAKQYPDATEEELERRMERKYRNIPKAIPIEKSAEFKAALANGVNKQRGNVGSVGASTPSQNNRSKLQGDLRSAPGWIKANPSRVQEIIKALQETYPDVDIATELERIAPGILGQR